MTYVQGNPKYLNRNRNQRLRGTITKYSVSKFKSYSVSCHEPIHIQYRGSTGKNNFAHKETIAGEFCYDQCAQAAYNYYWCRTGIPPSVAWNYCSPPSENEIHFDRYGKECRTACRFDNSGSAWCDVGTSWEYCGFYILIKIWSTDYKWYTVRIVAWNVFRQFLPFYVYREGWLGG